jgi:hypothetical protein
MKMGYRLLAVVSTVEYRPVAVVQTFLPGNPAGHDKKMADKLPVFLLDIVKARNHLAWTYEDVCGSLRVDVAKCETGIICEHDLRRDISIADLLEECLLAHLCWAQTP